MHISQIKSKLVKIKIKNLKSMPKQISAMIMKKTIIFTQKDIYYHIKKLTPKITKVKKFTTLTNVKLAP